MMRCSVNIKPFIIAALILRRNVNLDSKFSEHLTQILFHKGCIIKKLSCPLHWCPLASRELVRLLKRQSHSTEEELIADK